jgi:hypothetical protein
MLMRQDLGRTAECSNVQLSAHFRRNKDLLGLFIGQTISQRVKVTERREAFETEGPGYSRRKARPVALPR